MGGQTACADHISALLTCVRNSNALFFICQIEPCDFKHSALKKLGGTVAGKDGFSRLFRSVSPL